MNMPKSRDIQAKIPLPQAIWNEFWLRYEHNLQISLIPCHAIRLDICIYCIIFRRFYLVCSKVFTYFFQKPMEKCQEKMYNIT